MIPRTCCRVFISDYSWFVSLYEDAIVVDEACTSMSQSETYGLPYTSIDPVLRTGVFSLACKTKFQLYITKIAGTK